MLQGATPKLPDQIQIVGYDITTSRRKHCKSADKRCTKATIGADRIQHAPLGRKRRRVAVEGKTIPTAVYGMNWAQPTLNAARKLRSTILKWRCVEVVTGILNDPTKVDHTFAAVMRTMIDTRRILMKSESRYLQAVRILHKYAAGIQHSAGPVHGFVVKAATAGIVVSNGQMGKSG